MKHVAHIYQRLADDSLYRNSIYLMLSTAVMAFFGFFFWFINARVFSPEEVGVGTTIISVMTLLSSVSLLGLGNSLIKYLPASERKNEKINTSFALVIVTSFLVSIVYLIFLKTFSPRLLFLKDNIIFSLLFILIIVFAALNTISENVFIAYRSANYVLMKNTVIGTAKLMLPFLFVTFGSYGIFMSVGISLIIGVIFGVSLLIIKFKYVIKPIINIAIVKKMTTFSVGNYVAGFTGALPAMCLPILITNTIGATFSAYFYMDMMIANLLYIIPIASAQSLFVEGSYSDLELKKHMKKAIKIVSLTIIPAIVATIFFGKYILLLFGKEYSNEGVVFLQLLAVSGLFVSVNYIGDSILYVRHKIKRIILINIIGSFAILSLSFLLIGYGLQGIGIAWLSGYVLVSAIYVCLWIFDKSRSLPS